MKVDKNRIVVTGVGPVTSIGFGKEIVWKNILEKKISLSIEKYKLGSEEVGSFYKHKIKDFELKNFNLDNEALSELESWNESKTSVDLYYLIAAIKLALDDSKLYYEQEDNEISLIVTHENPGLGDFYSSVINESIALLIDNKKKITQKKFLEAMYHKLSKEAYNLQTFMFLFQIAKFFKIHGYSQYLNNACSSGLYAIEAASQIIKTNLSSVVIVAAGDHADIFKYLWFKRIGLYSKSGIIKPFSRESDGFVFGDGSIAIVLESLDHALKRKARIYAEYLGGGFSLEGWKVSFPAITKDYYSKALNQAFKRSKIFKDQIELVVPHGVGSKIVDKFEANVIKKVFGKFSEKQIITTFKPYFGHNLGGSALLETAILMLSIYYKVIPPSLNCENLDPTVGFQLLKKPIKANINYAMKMACGFAGYNAASIFSKFE